MPGEASAKKHEFIGVCILIIAVLLLLCLLSYNPHDSSLNALSLKLSIDNKIGKIGAYASDFLFQTVRLPCFPVVGAASHPELEVHVWTAGLRTVSQDFRFLSFACVACSRPPVASDIIAGYKLHARRRHRCFDRRHAASQPEPNRHRYRCCRCPDIGHIGIDNPFA